VLKAINTDAAERWASHVLSSPGLQPSHPYPPVLRMQYYLTLPPFTGSNTITKARINSLFLFDIPPYNMSPFTCPLCNHITNNPRLHFLTQCPSLLHLRNHHPQLFKHATQHNTDTTLSTLLLATTPLNTDTTFIYSVGSYLHKLWHLSLSHRHAQSGPPQGTPP